MEIKNKTIIITGGARGIGKACALELAKKEAKVIIADIHQLENEEEFKKLNCLFIRTDITMENEVEKLRDFAMEKTGKIDVLINNAAKQTQNEFFKMSPSEFKEVIDVNLNGTFICSHIIGKEMKPSSKIINMLSVHYDLPRKNKYHYDASKAGVAILTKEMALDLVEKGITVNGISYGACNTPMNSDWLNDEKKVETTLSKIPLRWIAQPEEIAKFTSNILENFSDYTTGTIFTIDGGRNIMG